MIRLQRLTLTRGKKNLLDAADCLLNPGEKIALIGANGTGKSSLFALLRGELHADGGEVELPATWKISSVAQETPALDRAAVEYAMDGDAHLRQLQRELAEVEAHPEHDGHRAAELHAALADAGAYTLQSRAEQLLAGLGFTQAQMTQPVAAFSGGWRMRLNLAQALMSPADLLLLDEPTNHLDLDAIIWLEDWLRRYPGTVIVISHDRDFLDGVVHVVIHLEACKLKRYSGNYSAFERQRAANLVLSQAAIAKQQRERAHLQSFVDRFKAQATKARQAQSRMKMLAKMEELAPIHAAAAFSFEFREPERAPDPLLTLENVSAGYRNGDSDNVILHDVNFSIRAGERIGLLGANGAGKSTLIKTIAGDLAPLSGTATFGKGLMLGYFAQHQLEMLRADQSPLWHLSKLAPNEREQELRNFLGGFNFDGDMVTQPIAPFSGGEKARLALALIVWQRPNLLLLDEPTNHLDLDTREALTVALAQFEGTLVLISHDRHLLGATTESLVIIADGKVQPFDGDLDDYRDWLFKSKLAKAASSPADTAPATDRREQRRLDAEARQRSAALKKPIEKRIQQLETRIAECNARKAVLDTLLADTAIYEDACKAELKTALHDQLTVSQELERLEDEWLEQQTALEEISP
jgi:ATP-binding cassette, subfamily F, member 3